MAKTIIKKRKSGPELKRADATPADNPPAATAPAPTAPTALPPFKEGPSYGIFAILMLVATVCFVAVVVLQYVEWRYYHQPPTAFLSTQAVGAPPVQ